MKNSGNFTHLGLFSLLLLLLAQSCSNKQAETTSKDDASEFYTLDDFAAVEKYDTHMHLRDPGDTIFIDQAEVDNFKMITINVNTSASLPVEEQENAALNFVQAYPDRVAYATAFSIEGWNRDDWTQKTIDYLESSFEKGATAVKVWKNIGLELKDENGEFVMIDHPKFDPVIDVLVKHNITMIGHLGEPKNTWLPIEVMTVGGDKSYFTEHPQYHMYKHPEYPDYDKQIAARDHMLEKHPDLAFVGAHLGSLEWSVDELAKRLDKFPNMSVDMAERISHLQYQALTDWQKVHDFVIKYQDRLLYGTDLRASASDIVESGITEPSEIKKHAHDVWVRHWKFFTTDEMMSVPKVKGEFKGLKLPKEVIDKIYRKNAEKWILK